MYPNLFGIVIPNTLIKIGDYGYNQCQKLDNLQLPLSLSSIGMYAFEGCSNLSEINLPEQLTEIGRVAFGHCTSLKKIRIPENITEIKDHTFIGCSNLKEIVLSKGLKVVEDIAFEGCLSLNEIVIPSSVSYLGHACFARTELKKLQMLEESIPEVTNDIFEDGDTVYETCELTVLESLLTQYKSHPIFGKFLNIQGYSGVEIMRDITCICDVYYIDGSLIGRGVVESEAKESLASGIYILWYSDGSTKKIAIK